MIFKRILLFSVLFHFSVQAQEFESTEHNDKIITLVNAFVNSTYKGNSISDFSDYGVDTKKVSKYTMMFKILKQEDFLFFKSLEPNKFSFNKQSKEFKSNLANIIIWNVIKQRKRNLRKRMFYSVNYYSKNLFKVKNAPEKVISFDLGDFEGGIDSTRSGIVYLSETVSKVLKKRNLFKERLLAVKVNGLKDKLGFNRVANTNFNFYKNLVTFGGENISPIANYAFRFYKYVLEESFYEDNFLIHKIKIVSKRKYSNVFRGYIYVVEESSQIYAVDLFVKGNQLQNSTIDYIKLKQQYKYNRDYDLWLLENQQSDFKMSEFNINVSGKKIAYFSNYTFNKRVIKNKFNNELFSFFKTGVENSTLIADSRPIPLKKFEEEEYKRKEKVYHKRSSKKYLDSINVKVNKFTFSNLIFDYNHRNLYKQNRLKISFPLNTMFNTVQGWHSMANVSYFKKKQHQNYLLSTNLDYGYTDKQLRATGKIAYRFNNKTKSTAKLTFGRALTEFNDPYSTSPLFNMFSTLLFEDNNSKFYDRYFTEFNYQKEIFNGIYFNTGLSYNHRKPVFNKADFTFINLENQYYTSNNPLEPENFQKTVIKTHDLVKFKANFTYKMGQKYVLLPDKKVNLSNSYPTISVNYTKGFSSKQSSYNFDYLEARVFQHFKVSDMGVFSYNIKGGQYFNQNEMSFVDYKHFDITQVHVSLVRDYTNYFALLPSYSFSTNTAYTELHIEHQFNKYLLRKIPIVNRLQFELIVGANALLTQGNKPYTEISIGLSNLGLGRYRFLRVDYVRSFIGDKSLGSFIFGLSL